MNDGTFHGRQAIEKSYAKYDFERWQVHNYFTKVYLARKKARLSPAGAVNLTLADSAQPSDRWSV